MSRNVPAKASAPAKSQPKKRKPDERTRRTCERLGMALITLMQEQPIEKVTVQDVLDRAEVGRSTFYVHYRDKDDLLFSQLEMFCEHMSTVLDVRKEKSDRVAAVTEVFDHVGQENKLFRALADSGHLHDFYALAEGYFTRGIEQRLKQSPRAAKLSPQELRVRSAALAGSFLSLMRWWIDTSAKQTPREMDELFHRMVWNGMR